MWNSLKPDVADYVPRRFEIYSRHGKLLCVADTQVEAERLLGTWYSAAYVIEVLPSGERRPVPGLERKELRP